MLGDIGYDVGDSYGLDTKFVDLDWQDFRRGFASGVADRRVCEISEERRISTEEWQTLREKFYRDVLAENGWDMYGNPIGEQK